jgi:Zn-dependent protease
MSATKWVRAQRWLFANSARLAGLLVSTKCCAIKLVAMGAIRFGLLGFQIQIQPSFWWVALVLLLVGAQDRNPVDSILLVAIVFVSIVTHEMGHALAAKRAGLSPVVVIHAFGGFTRWPSSGPVERGKVVAIALAGPIAGLIVAAGSVLALVGLSRLVPVAVAHKVRPWIVTLAQVNGFWSFANLLPIVPFDGGQVMSLLLGPRRRVVAARISLAVGCATAFVLFRFRLQIAALVFASASIAQFITVMRVLRAGTAVDVARFELVLTQAQRALEAGDAESAETAARYILESAAGVDQRRHAAEIVAWVAIGRGQLQDARKALEAFATGPWDPLLQAAVLEADGDFDRAIACLRQARVVGDSRPQVAASLVRLLLAADRFGEAALTTIQILDHVTLDEARQVMHACHMGARPVPAAELGMALYAHAGDVDDLAWALVCFSISGSQQALDGALAAAAKSRVNGLELLNSAAFLEVAEGSDLRRLVAALGEQ